MKETAIIEFDVKDKDVLMTIFERFKVVFKSKTEIETNEVIAVRTALNAYMSKRVCGKKWMTKNV